MKRRKKEDNKYRRNAKWVRWWLGVIGPLLVLGLSGFFAEWHQGAIAAGAFSIVAQVAIVLSLRYAGLPLRSELLDTLFWCAVPLGVVIWGAGQSVPVAILGIATSAGVGAAWLYYRDMVLLASIVLGVLGTWSFVLVGSFGTWPAAALAASASGFAAAVAYYVGRIVQGYGWRSPLSVGLYLAAPPVGLLLLGLGIELQHAAPLVLLVAAAGVVVAVVQKDWVNDG